MDDQKSFLLILIAIAGFVASLMLRPFLTYLLAAVILAFVFRKPHSYLKKYLGENISSAILTISSVFFVLIPVILMFTAVADDARSLIDNVEDTNIDIDKIEQDLEQFTGQEIEIRESLASALRDFSSATIDSFSAIFNVAANIALGTMIMLFLLYYFIKDGNKFINFLTRLSPLERDTEDRLLNELEVTTSAVMKGHILVAVAQGLVAGLGFAVLGIPNYIFWTFVMIILAVIPLIGATLVWLPAAIYLIIYGDTLGGAILILYGLFVVSIVDNALRPVLVDKKADLHPGIIILGVIGGVSVLGAPGLFLGPIVFGVLKSVLNVFIEKYNET